VWAVTRNDKQVVILTGAAGFIGSAVAIELARNMAVIAIDRRVPSRALLQVTEKVEWHLVDIADQDTMAKIFQSTKKRLGRIDFVLHLAAFYHFGSDWLPEYQRTNMDGTSMVLQLAIENGARRMIFASSLAAMLPPPKGEMLTERSPTSAIIPYGESKSAGERLILDASRQLPAMVLRIGGVFTDWCELPPLDSLIRQWAGGFPLNRIVAGHGNTAIPYIHRDDLVGLLRACLDQSERLGAHEVLLASQHGSVSHLELFDAIGEALPKLERVRPIFVSPTTATIGLTLKLSLGLITRNPPYERRWMLQYIDRPWIADTSYTRNILGWDCTRGKGILDRLPTMVDHYLHQRLPWNQRSRARTSAKYLYASDSDYQS
jgi:nucleoside-diphosphate-sugar epimerase